MKGTKNINDTDGDWDSRNRHIYCVPLLFFARFCIYFFPFLFEIVGIWLSQASGILNIWNEKSKCMVMIVSNSIIVGCINHLSAGIKAITKTANVNARFVDRDHFHMPTKPSKCVRIHGKSHVKQTKIYVFRNKTRAQIESQINCTKKKLLKRILSMLALLHTKPCADEY